MKARRKSAKTKRPSPKREKIEISSGNVFADLGFEDSEERLLKAKLASKIAQSMEEKVRTQAQTAVSEHDVEAAWSEELKQGSLRSMRERLN